MGIYSEFNKDLSKFEPTYRWGINKKQLKMIVQIIPGIVLIGLEVFFVGGIWFWIASILTALILITPPVLVAFGKWESFKKDLDFFLKYQDRYLVNEKIRRYDSSEFIKKNKQEKTSRPKK